jgi:hypothetical protein
MKNIFIAGVLGSALLFGATSGHAASWVKIELDPPNKNVEANYYKENSVKVRKKTLSWTEKFDLTSFGTTAYTKHLSQYPACKMNISTKGDVTQHQVDLEIKGGKFRLIAKRNYNKANELVCTDKDMGTELDRSWHEVEYQTPMYERNYLLSTKYKIGDLP